ncbi:unnamed protein product [Ectocarpus sp. 4 AP-2014]
MWGRSELPNGLEGEQFFPDVVPKVDPVDFHDSGEEESGNYDLVEDLVTEETYKVAKDQALEFFASGSGPRLERARLRAARAAKNKNARRRRRRPSGGSGNVSGGTSSGLVRQGSSDDDRNGGGSGGFSFVRSRGKGGGDGSGSSSVDSSSSSGYSSYGGRSTSGSGSDTSDVENGGTKKKDDAADGLEGAGGRGGREEALEEDLERYWSETPSGVFASSSSSSSSTSSDSEAEPRPEARLIAATAASGADKSGDGVGGNGAARPFFGAASGRANGASGSGDAAQEDRGRVGGADSASGGVAGASVQANGGTSGASAGRVRAGENDMDVDEEEEGGSTADKGKGPARRRAAARGVDARQSQKESEGKRLVGEVDSDDDEESSGSATERGSSSDGDGKEDEEGRGGGDDGLDGPGAVQLLGLKAEFMPVSQGAWEDAVCLGDSGESDAESRRPSPVGGRSRSSPVPTPMDVSASGCDEEREEGGGAAATAKQKDEGRGRERTVEEGAGGAAEGISGSKGGSSNAAAAGAASASAETKKPAAVAASAAGAAASGSKKVGRRRAGMGMGMRTTAFPAAEGSPWIDPPSVLNPQVDGGGWESQVLLDDSQKLKKPTIPVYLDDPDMLFGALHTPRPSLRILQTEAQQENSHILERTNRRQMATEKQKRLQSAAMKTGYTINTVGDGKASRAESNIRAVIIRPPHHASPAEDKVLIAAPKSWDDIRNLHRPRMQIHTLLPNQMSIVRLPRKPKALQGGGQGGGGFGARIGEVVSMPMHREKDLLPLESHSTFVVVEYVEERPPLLGSTGMASTIITFVRSSSRRPIGGIEAGRNSGAAGFGETRELSPQEDSPFLGEIRPGSEQASICNGLFRAPIFKHHAPDSDFLLIREPMTKKEKERSSQKQKSKKEKSGKFFFSGDKGGGGSGGSGGGGKNAPGGGAASSSSSSKATFRHNQFYVIRPMPVVFLVGQTEPQMEALEPTKVTSKATHLNIVTFLAKRLFDTTKAAQAGNAGIPFKKVLEEARFLSLPRAKDAAKARLKEMIREIGERRDARDDGDGPVSTESLWAAKPDLNMQQVTAQAAKLFRQPEDFCALESMVSAWAHLSDVGLDTLTSHDAVAKFLLKIKKRHDCLLAQVKEVRSASSALSKKKSVLARAARVRGRQPPEHDGGLTRRLACMEKLSETLGTQLTELKRVRAVAQYMYKELQMVPWTLTINYLKRHGITSSPAASLLMLSGMGDPSGCGEGFSFLPRPAEQAKATASLTTSQKIVAERSVQKVTGTNSDLRRLTMLQLASTCEAMGIPKDTVKTLRRWDRVHMIKELAGVAVAENVKDQNIYARFVRKRRPNATIDKDLYRETCNEIWERQALALSATAEDVQEYGSESASSSKVKDKAEASKGKGGEASKGKAAGASPGGSKDSDKGEEKEDGDDDKEDDGDDDDDLDGLDVDDLDLSGDDDDDENDGLNLSDMEETLEGGDGDGDAPVPKSLQDLSSSSQKNKDELDDERQYRMLQQDLHGVRGEAARWGTGEGPDAAPQGSMSLNVVEARKAQTEELLGQLGGRAQLPAQAVRRITRTVGPDGTETVRVSYSLRRQDLVRLDARGGKKQTALSKSAAASGGVGGASPMSFFLPRPQAFWGQRGAAAGQEETVLKIRLKTGGLPTAAPKENKKKRRRSSTEVRVRKPEENIYAIQRQNSRSTVESRDSRPRNRMRSLLTGVVKNLSERPDAIYFRAPVKRNVPDYYTKIKKPMDLRTIQDKINNFDYTSRENIIADMQQLVTNAEIYNGHGHVLAQNARDIMADCQAQLEDPEIAEVEEALTAEHPAPRKKLKTGGSGGSGGGGAIGGGKPAAKKKTKAVTGGRRSPSQGGMSSASQARVSALAASMSTPSSAHGLPGSLSSLQHPRADFPTTARHPNPKALPGGDGASPAARPRKSTIAPPSAMGFAGKGADAGTSSDSSDGEEVVEEGGRIGF